MSNSVDQQVIEFTAAYTGVSVGEISNSTTLDSLGIVTKPDLYEYLTELEDSFELIFEPSDADGIVTVGNAAAMIEKKLGSNAS
ncbi:MAG TPA: acyl carrier protein [Ignavibacteria bacterium]|nr:acyl carrier protein [Ignavibacteria bacterium]